MGFFKYFQCDFYDIHEKISMSFGHICVNVIDKCYIEFAIVINHERKVIDKKRKKKCP